MSKIKTSVEVEKSFIKKKEINGLVDMDFLTKLTKLIKIAIPRLVGRESLAIILLSGLLVLRTVLSIYISDVNGSIVKAIVNRSLPHFIKQIVILALYSLPSAVVNSSLDYFNKLLGLFFRENLSKYFHNKYLTNMCFYQITNLDNRITNPDQIFTNDIEKWAYSLASLYSNFSKPVLDLILFSRKLSETLGWEGPMLMIGWYFLSGFLIKFVAPPLGKLTAIEQTLEGEFRACHSALITHSEEIAFYKGNKWEQKRINETFNELVSHVNNIYTKKFYMGIIDSMLVKYGAVMTGYTILGLPVFGGRHYSKYAKTTLGDASVITKDYIRNSSLLINLAKAIGRIVVSYKDLQNLSGYTYLVNQLDVVIDDISKEKFNRTQVKDDLLKKYVGGTVS
jgi:ATP-binding cassette subfamily D (ALD) protein 3